jgi:hypothetical protein
MTVGIAVAVANAELNRFRNVAAAAIPAVYAKLHTADPGVGATAAAAGSTTRNAVTFSAASGGSMSMSALGAWTNGGATETVTHLSLWDDPTAGNFLGSIVLTASLPWVNTNTLTITALTLTRTPIAA